MKHLAMIMDGNRRWAKENGIASLYGNESKKSVRTAIAFCIKNGIKYLSLYAFSLENFNRSETEKAVLFSLLKKTLTAELPELIEQGVRVRLIGDKNYFPEHLRPAIESGEKRTEHLTTLNLNILFCYGGQQEIVHSVKAIAEKVKKGELDLDSITTETVSGSLWTSGMPEPELIIRTSGVYRLSNFLTYQAAYSEFAFLKCHWPEITEEHLRQCLDDYQDVKRNFGH